MSKLKPPKKAPLSQMVAPHLKQIEFGALDYDPRFDPRAKEQQRIKETKAIIEPRLKDEPPTVSLVDFEGYPFVTSMSDRTAAGGLLTNVEGVDLSRPVNLQGGQDYMFENPGQVWASGVNPVNQIMTSARILKEASGKDPLYMPWRMAPTGGDFASMAGETMLNYADSAMGARAKQRLNKQIRQFIPDWAGVESPESINQFRDAPDAVRKQLKNIMDVNFRDEGGLNIGQARLAVTDPRQANAPESHIMNVGRIFADQPIVQESGHVWYPRGVPGEGIGIIDQPRSIFELLPEYAKERGIPDPSNPRQTDIRSMQMKPYSGVITDKLLKSLGYKDGGIVEDAMVDKVKDPQAAEMLNLDLAKLATMSQPQGLLGGGKPRQPTFLEQKNMSFDQYRNSIGMNDGGNMAKGGKVKPVMPKMERDANLARFVQDSAIKDRMYHSTTQDFNQFDTTKKALMGEGSWFSKEPLNSFAEGEGGNVMPNYLSLRNPKILEAPIDSFNKNKLIEEGYDGVVIKSPINGEITSAVAFEPTQIKSAIGNRGTYDITDPDITKKDGGIVQKMAIGGTPFSGGSLYDDAEREAEFRNSSAVPSMDDYSGIPAFSVYNKREYDTGVPSNQPKIDQQRYELTMKGQEEAAKKKADERKALFKPYLGGIDPNTVLGAADALGTAAKSMVAAPAYIAGNAYDLLTGKDTAESRGKSIEEWMSPKTQEGYNILETIGSIPEKITGSTQGFGMHPNMWFDSSTPSPAQMKAALKFGTHKYGVPLAEKGLSMWEQGKGDPLSILSEKTTGMQGNPALTEIFAGSKSKTADLAMRDIAEARLSAGEDPALVWKETGWGRPPWGGDLRYEISDTGLDMGKTQNKLVSKISAHGDKMNDLAVAYLIKKEMAEGGKELPEVLADWKYEFKPSDKALKMAEDESLSGGTLASRYKKLKGQDVATYAKLSGDLGKFVDHPEFFAAYPDLAELVKFQTLGASDKSGAAGMFDPAKKELSLRSSTARGDTAKSVTAHELSHAVQHREGFPAGGNPEAVVKRPELFDPATKQALTDLNTAIANDPRITELKDKMKIGHKLTDAENDELLMRSQSLPEHQAYLQARNDYLSSGTPMELYNRLAGEAEARLTQHRLDYPEDKRRDIYPYDPVHFRKATGYNLDDITANPSIPNASISMSTETPSVAQMKAELKQKKLAPANDMGFYSPVEAAALNLQRKSGNGQAFLNDIMKGENVRPDEIKAMGLDTWLKDKKNVTADEVQFFVNKAKIKLEEDVFSGKDTRYNDYSMPGGKNYREVVLKYPNQSDDSQSEVSSHVIRLRDRLNDLKKAPVPADAEGHAKKIQELEGELNTWKTRSSALSEMPYKWNDPYTNHHWDETENPLAHLRMKDYTDVDGKKVLLVDEVQSDWHQAGREQGYKENLDSRKLKVKSLETDNPNDVGVYDENGKELWVGQKQKENEPAYRTIENAIKQIHGEKVPNAPFKEDWYQLALKRAIKEAIDNGYDRVALPTGGRVADRFELSNSIDRIDYVKNSDGTYDISAIKDGSEVFSKEGVNNKELSGIVGKDLSKKMYNDEGKSPETKADRWEPEDSELPNYKSLSGLDLKIGGEGMRKYYDEVYPNFLKKFGKKYGANVGTTHIDVDGAQEPLHYMEITPAMRKEFKTGIHMKAGGKVSFAKYIDAMRLELNKG